MVEVVTAKKLPQANEDAASANRALLEQKGIVMVNLIGKTGAGKTTLLEKAMSLLIDKYNTAIISGGNTADVEGLVKTGAEIVRIDAGEGSPLDAGVVAQALGQLPLDVLDLIFVETDLDTVGPTAVDLGEQFKVIVASVDEGMDKPEQYIAEFRDAFAAVINKVDLLPDENFDLGLYINRLLEVNNKLKIFPVSAEKGEGIEEWSQLIGRMLWKGRRSISVN